MADDDFLNEFHAYIEDCIDEKGMGIGHGLAHHVGGARSMYALALENPGQAYVMILGVIKKGLSPEDEMGPVEKIVFGWDRYTVAGQGNPYKDCISVHYYDASQNPRGEWRFGIIDYQAPKGNKPKIVNPINWDNAHWKEMLEREFVDCMHLFMQYLKQGTLEELMKPTPPSKGN